MIIYYFNAFRLSKNVNPSDGEATYVQCTRKERSSKRCHVGIHWIALARISVIFLGFCINITEKLVHQHAQNTTFGIYAAVSLFRLTGWFHIHLFLFIYVFVRSPMLTSDATLVVTRVKKKCSFQILNNSDTNLDWLCCSLIC